MIALGQVALALAAVFAVAAILFLALGVRGGNRDLLRNGYYAVYALFLAVVVASAVLLGAFVGRDYGFQYVFDNSDPSLSLFYRLAGFWAGQQGSFLLWLFFLALITVIIALRRVREPDVLDGAAVLALSAVCAFFAALMLFDKGSNPFVANPEAGATPLGLNPLLLHPAMVLHPPALFFGYAGLTVPWAFAFAALLLGRADNLWVRLCQKWGVAGWLFLSVGIGLGAWWAYVVLGWGGYWGWDPVENSSFIPWLTATALLHSMNLYVKRGTFKRWALSLATLTFLLVIVATWVTRSGAIESQHAFQSAPLLSRILIGFMLVVAVSTAALMASRWRLYESERTVESVASREFMYYFADIALVAFAAAILFTTVGVPLLMHQSVVATTYDSLARPLGVLFVLLIGICPLMAWGRTEGRTFWRKVRMPLIVAAVAAALLLLAGWGSEPVGFVGLVAAAFSGAAVVQFLLLRAAKARGAGFAARLWNTLAFSRTRTAAIVSHLGMVVILVGLIGSNVYKLEGSASLATKPGETATVGDYTLRFVSYDEATGAQQAQRTLATFDVYRGDTLLGRVSPHMDFYPNTQQTAPRAVILGGVWSDLFLAPNAFDSERVDVKVDVFPLIRFVWIGSILLVGGAVVSLWPASRRAPAPASEKVRPPRRAAGDIAVSQD